MYDKLFLHVTLFLVLYRIASGVDCTLHHLFTEGTVHQIAHQNTM